MHDCSREAVYYCIHLFFSGTEEVHAWIYFLAKFGLIFASFFLQKANKFVENALMCFYLPS